MEVTRRRRANSVINCLGSGAHKTPKGELGISVGSLETQGGHVCALSVVRTDGWFSLGNSWALGFTFTNILLISVPCLD